MDWHVIILGFPMIVLTQYSDHMVRCDITGGPTSNKGTVEIRVDNGTWETTCGANLGISDVTVICRQLGFTGANIVILETPYAQHSTPTKGLGCLGVETDLSECGLFPSAIACSDAGGASCHGEDYLGCFRDQRDDRALPGDNLISDTSMTISYCIQFCVGSTTANYSYAGVEHGSECYCGEADARYYGHGEVPDSLCHTPCSGDLTESCGGIGYIAVFTTLNSTNQDVIIVYMSTAATSAPSSASKAPKTTFALPRTGDNTGLYAGVAGGVAAFIIIVIIIIIIFFMKRRSRKGRKDPTSSQRMSLATASTPTGINGLGITNAALEETSAAGGSQLGLHASNNAAASVSTASGGDKSGLLVNLNPSKSMNIYGGIDDEVQGDKMMPYASFDTAATVQNNNGRLSVVYSMPDKNGNGPRNDTSEDFGSLYAIPDKLRGQPDGNDDGIVHGLYAKADESLSGDQYEPDMVENELYTI